MRYIIPLFVLFLASCKSQYYYVVRHAEKDVVNKDSLMFSPVNPPLSEAGKVRAFVLRDELKKKKIGSIFSTNYHRTIATAKPLSEALGNMPIQLYSPSKDSLPAFISKLKAIEDKNVLVVGHSNTVDDVVNMLTGQKHVPNDLLEVVYDNMFIIKRKKDKWEFTKRTFGYPSNPER